MLEGDSCTSAPSHHPVFHAGVRLRRERGGFGRPCTRRAAAMGLLAARWVHVHGSASVAGAASGSAEDNAVCGAGGMCAKQLK